MPTKKAKHPKLDPYLISLKQKYEVTHVVERFKKKYGVTLTREQIKDAVKAVGHGRKKVYSYLSKGKVSLIPLVKYRPKKK